MKSDTSQWVNKAEDDFRVAERELRVTDLPSYFDATLPAAQEALAASTRVRAFIRGKIGLPEASS